MCDAAGAAVSLLEDIADDYGRARRPCPDPACGYTPAGGSEHADGCKFAAYLRFRPLPRPQRPARAKSVQFLLGGGRRRLDGPSPPGGMMVVRLADGRRISVPLRWFPRLAHGAAAELARWELIGRGSGIHWPLLDEDISVGGLLAGRRSGECGASVAKWRKWLAAERLRAKSAGRRRRAT